MEWVRKAKSQYSNNIGAAQKNNEMGLRSTRTYSQGENIAPVREGTDGVRRNKSINRVNNERDAPSYRAGVI